MSNSPLCAVPLIGAVEVELLGRAWFAGELAQARNADLMLRVPSSTWVVEVLETSRRSQTFDGAEVAVLVWRSDAFGIVAIRRRTARCRGGADPILAALMAALLLGKALLERSSACRGRPWPRTIFFSSSVRYFSASFLATPSEKFLGRERPRSSGRGLEHVPEHAVELVEVALVLHQRRAREVNRSPPPGGRQSFSIASIR